MIATCRTKLWQFLDSYKTEHNKGSMSSETKARVRLTIAVLRNQRGFEIEVESKL